MNEPLSLPQPSYPPLIGLSFFLHILMFGIFTVKGVFFPHNERIEYQPSVRVDIVALPDKAMPAQPAPQTNATQMAPPSPPKGTDAAVNPQQSQKSREELRRQALARIKNIAQNQPQPSPQPATNTVSGPIKGNRVTEGSRLTGLSRIEYDDYVDRLHTHLHAHWTIPEWLSAQGLSAVVLIYLDEQGYVIDTQMMQHSGNAHYDKSVLQAITRANPFPAPQNEFIDIVGLSGVTINVKP